MSLHVTAAQQVDGVVEAGDGTVAASADPQPSSPRALAAATDGSFAGKLLAEADEVGSATKRFPVPGWVRDGEPSLMLVAKQTKHRIKGSVTNEKFIIDSTEALLYRDDDGKLQQLDDGWATVALEMGPDHSTGDAVRKVLSSATRLDVFAARILAWNAGRLDELEDALGE